MKKESKKEIICSITEAYLKGGFISSFIISPFILIYIVLYQQNLIENLIAFQNKLNYSSIIIIIISGIIIHELTHGITWSLSSKKSFSNIKFGIDLKSFTPYCHFKIPIKKTSYVLGTIMPFIILGLLPLIWSIYSGHIHYLFWGILFTYAASGDFICIWKIKKIKTTNLIQDHPDKIGCIIHN